MENLGCSIEHASEHAYLVSLGVRPMAWITQSVDDEEKIPEILDELHHCGHWYDNVVPFVVLRRYADAEIQTIAGYVAEEWIIDLLEWMENNAPERCTDYVVGLLLGYSPGAIKEYDARMYIGDATTPPISSERCHDSTWETKIYRLC